MIKRLGISLLIIILVLTSIGGNEIYATSIDESVFDIGYDEEIIEMGEDADSEWSKLYKLALSYEAIDDKNLEFDTSIKADDTNNSLVTFNCADENGELKLILNEELVDCVFVYSTVDNISIASMLISDIEGSINFERNETMSEYEMALLNANAGELLNEAIVLWNEILSQNDLSWFDFGFTFWGKLCDEVLKDETESIKEIDYSDNTMQDNDELVDEVIEEADETILETDFESEEDSCYISVDGDAWESLSTETDEAEELVIENEIDDLNIDSDVETLDVDDLLIGENALDATPAPNPEPERISFNKNYIEMKAGESVVVSPKVYPENADQSVTWIIDDEDKDYISYDSSKCILSANKSKNEEIRIKICSTDFPLVKTELIVKVNANEIDDKHGFDENGNETFKIVDGEKIFVGKDIWIGGLNKSENTYTGKAIKQNLIVYNKSEKLTLNKDYALSYKNNINACGYDELKAASVTVTMKGAYSGKRILYFGIDQADIKDARVENDKTALTYNGKEQKFVPTITYNGKKLVNNKDFVIKYLSTDLKGNPLTTTTCSYVIEGKGNFKGSIAGEYYIAPKQFNLSKAKVTLNSSVKYDGTEITPDKLNISVKMPGETVFVNSSDYNVVLCPDNPITGTAKVIITGNGLNVSGSITKTFKILPAYNISKDTELSSSFINSQPYYKDSESNKQANEDGLLVNKNTTEQLELDTDYKLVYSNIDKAGTAKVTFKGMGAYSGSITKSYNLAVANPTLSLNVDSFSEQVYIPGGNKVDFEVINYTELPNGTFGYETLKENVDYTVQYANNKAVGEAKVKVSFKGSYAGAEPIEKAFTIIKAPINQNIITLADKAYSTKANAYKVKPVITSANGKKLVAGKDYESTFEYTYENCDETDAPLAGTIITVKITGKGNYSGTAFGCYKIYDKKLSNISKLYFDVAPQVYTGKVIEPKLGTDIKIYLSAGDLKNKTDEVEHPEKYVRIVAYKNNIKPGKGTIVLGSSVETDNKQYGGTKNVSFKINKKEYGGNAVKSISLPQFLELKSTTKRESTYLSAILNGGEATDNKKVIWKSSNPAAVSVTTVSETTCLLRAEGPGMAVISCTTQEGNLTAKCTVTSIMKPLVGIEFDKQSLSLELGKSTYVKAGLVPEDAYVNGMGKVEYISSDESIATVDSDGKVTAVCMGIASITAIFNGKIATCPVEVTVDKSTLTWTNIKDAIPDDDIDDTNAFNQAISNLMSKPVGQRNLFVPAGTYDISLFNNYDDGIRVVGLENAYIYMEPGVILRQNEDLSQRMRGIIRIYRSNNVTIEGGLIDCDLSSWDERDEMVSSNENHFGIMLEESSNICLTGINIKDSVTDGIYLGKGKTSNFNSNIYIRNCSISGSRRNGISVVNAINVTIDNCTLSDGRGYILPDYYYGEDEEPYLVAGLGIDIEPNTGDDQHARNIKINNCTFINNQIDFGIHCHYKVKECPNTSDITLDGCIFDKKVYIQCGENVKFVNTKRKPDVYYDDRHGGWITTFPDK